MGECSSIAAYRWTCSQVTSLTYELEATWRWPTFTLRTRVNSRIWFAMMMINIVLMLFFSPKSTKLQALNIVLSSMTAAASNQSRRCWGRHNAQYPDADWWPYRVTVAEVTEDTQNDIDVRQWECLRLTQTHEQFNAGLFPDVSALAGCPPFWPNPIQSGC